ncbi:alkaline phosphatase D [Knoellia remsis]|uniref:Alkaline phosphatase D n=1 Tax=Knoellia remsis TaxID=407159 RepID=A0A2T0UJT6_9MICO|nr:alkaline phosphatase D family protein [Knoellia remsis]PRY58211.1 alkaline phosphatase D [Knoellia remsis]
MASLNPILDRRQLLGLGGTAATVGAVALATPQPSLAAPIRSPFTLSVASGDPLPDGVVLWTRLAPEPLALDASGGMPARRVPVQWEVAEDPRFRRVVRRGVELATPEWNHSVHAEVSGLRPDRVYWYRFRTGNDISPVGRTRTAPALGTSLASMTFAFASCQAYYDGYFTAFDHMAQDDLDLVLHLGDYIYEGGNVGKLGRAHLPAHETFTLEDYRIRYSQYKLDPALQAAHAAAAWVVAPDDHDVENNWAGDHSQPDTEPDQDPAVFRARRAAAYRAYYENLPLRKTSMPSGPEMQVFRRLTFGGLAQVNVLDTRRWRDRLIASCIGDCRERWDTSRTMLGAEQEAWLLGGLASSTATWNVLANQVFMMEADHTAGDDERYGMDPWDGYAAARQRLFDGVHERGVENFVVVTGDAHRSVAADLKLDFTDAASATVGTEFLGTSISSGGDGLDQDSLGNVWLAENPHMRFHNSQRGYQRVHLTRDELRCDYVVTPVVTRPGGSAFTRASIFVEEGRAGIADVRA